MKLQQIPNKDLNWAMDFKPLKTWPEYLPALVAQNRIVAGFERRIHPRIDALILEKPFQELMEALWPDSSLAPLERLRKKNVLGQVNSVLLTWPLELQNFLDTRQVPLRSLKPLEHLGEWKDELSLCLLKTAFTSSELREIFDLLCDLKMIGKSWAEVTPKKIDHWLEELRCLRYPQIFSKDLHSQNKVQNLAWPKGIMAKWDRQGDQAGIVLQTKVSSDLEWKKLKETLSKLELGDGFWNH